MGASLLWVLVNTVLWVRTVTSDREACWTDSSEEARKTVGERGRIWTGNCLCGGCLAGSCPLSSFSQGETWGTGRVRVHMLLIKLFSPHFILELLVILQKAGLCAGAAVCPAQLWHTRGVRMLSWISTSGAALFAELLESTDL